GGTNIVIDVPGQMDQQTSAAIRQTAAMSFRPVLGVVAPEGSGEALPSDGGGASDAAGDESAGETSEARADPSQQLFSGLLSDDSSMAPATGTGEGDLPYPAWSMDSMTPEGQTELLTPDCAHPAAHQGRASETPPDAPVAAC